MSSLQDRLNKYLSSTDFKQRVHYNITNDPNFARGNGSGGTKNLALTAEKEFIELLEECINQLDSEAARTRFITGIRSSVYFVAGTGWLVDVYFDEDTVISNSLYWREYEMGAYLPVLFDQGYMAQNHVWGYDNNGNYITSKTSREASDFISKAANAFNLKHKNDLTFVEYNEVYGGSLTRGNLARGIF